MNAVYRTAIFPSKLYRQKLAERIELSYLAYRARILPLNHASTSQHGKRRSIFTGISCVLRGNLRRDLHWTGLSGNHRLEQPNPTTDRDSSNEIQEMAVPVPSIQANPIQNYYE